MQLTQGWLENAGVRLHYLEANADRKGTMPTVLWVPGGLGTAEQFAAQVEGYVDGHSMAVSLRGSGQSDTPDTGYSLAHFVSDLSCFLRHQTQAGVCLVAHSVAVTYALECAAGHPEAVKGLILLDWPPHYPALPAEFAENILRHSPPDMFKPQAIRGVQADSCEIDLADRLADIACPVLVIHGGQKGAQLDAAGAEIYRQRLPRCTVELFEASGHDPRVPDPSRFMQRVSAFVAEIHQGVQ